MTRCLRAVVVAGCVTAGAGAAPAGVQVVTLRAEGVEVGIVPRLAGRVIVFRRAGGPNLLAWDPAFERPADPASPSPDYEWKPYNGHIVWVGPQSGWWADQDVDASRRDVRAGWPPDPWGEIAPFSISLRTSRRLLLSGPPSPVTGLALTKDVEILRGGSVRVAVTAMNIRDRAVTRDLWPNTRIACPADVFVAAGPGGKIRIEHTSREPGAGALLDYRVVDGWFTFDAAAPAPDGAAARVAKAFLTPRAGLAAAFTGGDVFLKRFTPADPGLVHPEQGVVEIYQHADRDPARSLLEIETHSALTTLAPGETLAVAETWTATPYAGGGDPRLRAAFLTALTATTY